MAINLAALKGKSEAELLAIIASMDAQPARKLTCKVGKLGGVSVYGMNRFPITLYRAQWERLFAAQADITAFVEANAALLATGKDDPRFAGLRDED